LLHLAQDILHLGVQPQVQVAILALVCWGQ
jgi:hypothetical protein